MGVDVVGVPVVGWLVGALEMGVPVVGWLVTGLPVVASRSNPTTIGS